ncbi:MAG: TRAP transporter small permease [Caulobacterales bacterium]|nr:TRAP transporter small permease [Caulobacterales bacterium]
MLDGLERATRAISLAALWFAGAGLVAMTAVIGWQVVARYGLKASPAWSEQAALVLMIWYVLPAAAAGVREGFHIRITAGVDAMPARLGKAARLFSHAVVAVFGAALAYWGGELVARTWSHVIPTLGLPRGFAYLPMPLSGALIVLFAFEQMLADMRGRTVEPSWN